MIGFTSQKNYLKHHTYTSAVMNKPNTATAGFTYDSYTTITHNLGYIPLVRAFYDPSADGTIYPVNGQYGTQTAGPTSLPFWFYVDEITTATITFRAESNTLLSGTFTFYYRVYYDQTS